MSHFSADPTVPPAAPPAVTSPVISPVISPVTSPVTWTDPARQQHFMHWLQTVAPRHGIAADTLAPASADASFRRYLRVQAPDGARSSLIVMDAPPALEDVRPFQRVALLLAAAGLQVPQVLEADADHGFLLLTDLGTRPCLAALQQATPEGADRLMRPVLKALVQLQQRVPAEALPPFDEGLMTRELALFPEWCVAREFGLTWTAAQQAVWDRVCRILIEHMLAQPQVAVHADWMPRNLMLCGEAGDALTSVGVLDFQDAVRGPIGYDLASLLRDAFLSWDEAQEIDWAVRWWHDARRSRLPVPADFGDFWRDVEWTGLQRHLKVAGIFCRLKHRDDKPAYAEDLPRFFNYITRVANRYGPLRPLLGLMAPLSGARVGAGFTF